MYHAYDSLPDALKRRIAGRMLKHDGTYNSGGYLRQGVTAGRRSGDVAGRLASSGLHASGNQTPRALSGTKAECLHSGPAAGGVRSAARRVVVDRHARRIHVAQRVAGGRSGAVGQSLHHASPRPVRPKLAPRHASDADQERNASRGMRTRQAGRAHRRSRAAVRDVLSVFRRPREHLDRGAADQGGSQDQQHAARAGVLGVCDSLCFFPIDRRLDRRPAGSAADAGDLLRDRRDIDGADGRGHRNRVAVSAAARAGIRRRRRLPHGHARDGQLDAARQLGIRARDRAFVRADRQCGDAADHGGAAAVLYLARLIRDSGRGEPAVAGRMGLVFPQRSARASRDDSGDSRERCRFEPPARHGRFPGCGWPGT